MATWKIILALDFTLEQVETINIFEGSKNI